MPNFDTTPSTAAPQLPHHTPLSATCWVMHDSTLNIGLGGIWTISVQCVDKHFFKRVASKGAKWLIFEFSVFQIPSRRGREQTYTLYFPNCSRGKPMLPVRYYSKAKNVLLLKFNGYYHLYFPPLFTIATPTFCFTQTTGWYRCDQI